MSELKTSTIEQQESAADRVIIEAHYPQFSPQRLFDAFTKAELLTRWWSPAAETDPRPGGAYHLWWERLQKNLRGVYQEFVPGQRLAFTWNWDEEPDTPERIVEVDFLPGADGGSRLTITHGFYGAGDAEAEERRGHLEGWLYFLPMLDKLAAS